MGWQDDKALAEENATGAKLAKRWLNLQVEIQSLSHDARAEFDRILDNLVSSIEEELSGGQQPGTNSMGGPEPGHPMDGHPN